MLCNLEVEVTYAVLIFVFLGGIAAIATHFSVTRSVVCLSVCRVSRSYTLLKLFDLFR